MKKPVVNPRHFMFASQELRRKYYFDALRSHNIDLEKPVQVYRNLHNDLWSVRQNGIVRFHTSYICLKEVEFKVGEKGRERVLRENKKNVHAYIKGYIEWPSDCDDKEVDDDDINLMWTAVSYNPYYAGYFYEKENMQPVKSAEYIDMDSAEGCGEKVVAAWVE